MSNADRPKQFLFDHMLESADEFIKAFRQHPFPILYDKRACLKAIRDAFISGVEWSVAGLEIFEKEKKEGGK